MFYKEEYQRWLEKAVADEDLAVELRTMDEGKI